MKKEYKYYFRPQKIIRDLAHGYVNLTEFELKIIDTVSFQRLKDIRQLTCQEVYPSARHTRFEHSLGVLELTKQAIKHLNQNKFLTSRTETTEKEIIDEQLQLNATVAALLHDVGHCMFSHLGEKEFEDTEVYSALIEEIERFCEDHSGSISQCFIDYIKNVKLLNICSKHELISCIVILSKFEDLLLEEDIDIQIDDPSTKKIHIDFELIIRCILGIRYSQVNGQYDPSTANRYNVIIHLINDKIFDMDKLDYIMRDTVFTGINVSHIDTKRIFKNMFFEDNITFDIVFSSKAVPALQNYIEARDGLYMYVYNHHSAVLADFLNSYIIRRLSRNADKFLDIIDNTLSIISSQYTKINGKIDSVWERDYIYALGLVPRSYIFSIESIIDENRSDSDWISLVNTIYTRYATTNETPESVKGYLIGLMEECCYDNWSTDYPDEEDFSNCVTKICSEVLDSEDGKNLINNLLLTYKMISSYKKRNFLKPWWKTLSQFSIFLERNYKDVLFNGCFHEDIRIKICRMITYGTDSLPAEQLRAQIAKLVVQIANAAQDKLDREGRNHSSRILEPLEEGDFLITERSTRFNEIENIRKLRIVYGLTELEKSQNVESDHITKSLDDVIPQKEYRSIYNKESFYVYSRPLLGQNYSAKQKKEHYQCIEQIFVYTTIRILETNPKQLIDCLGKNANSDIRKAFFKNCIDGFLAKCT